MLLQPPSPRRHPHVLCSLACLTSQRSFTHHHIREKNISCLPSSPQWSHTLRRNAAYEWCHLLSSISALLLLINFTVAHRVIRGGFPCQEGLLLILLRMASTTCLFSSPRTETSEKTKTVSHCVDSSSSPSVTTLTSDDVLVGCKTLLLGVGLKWGDAFRGEMEGGNPSWH